MAYPREEHKSRKNAPLDPAWTVLSTGTSIPQQNNCNDCGVFLSFNANYITHAYQNPQARLDPIRPTGFDVDDMPMIRKQMQLDLLRGVVFPLPSP